MVQDADPDGLEGTDEFSGNQLISGGHLGDSARMLMSQDQSGRVPLEGFLHYLARIDGGAVDRAAEELDELDETVPVVEKEAAERFRLPRAELDCQKIAHRLGGAERSAAPEAA